MRGELALAGLSNALDGSEVPAETLEELSA